MKIIRVNDHFSTGLTQLYLNNDIDYSYLQSRFQNNYMRYVSCNGKYKMLSFNLICNGDRR